MWKLYEDLEELCETTANELDTAMQKVRSAGGKVSASDVAYLDQLTHMIKSIKTTMAMMDAEGGSSAMRPTYARRRDSMGRFSRAERSYADRAYDDGMIAQLKELMDDAPDEHTRQKFQKFINEMERA